MRNRRCRTGRRSFTLLEVLIAIALVMALLGSMFGFLFNLLHVRDEATGHSMRQRAANVLFERIERDLMTSLVGDESLGAGVQGDAASLRLLTRGVRIGDDEGVADEQRMFSDAMRVEYLFDESSHALRAWRGEAATSGRARTYEDVGEDIYLVRFRYLRDGAFSDSFDSDEAKSLPQAIEVSIWFDPWPGETMDAEADGALEPRSFDKLDRRPAEFDETFDEVESAMLSDLGLDAEPKPDRQRLIFVPDAGEGDS